MLSSAQVAAMSWRREMLGTSRKSWSGWPLCGSVLPSRAQRRHERGRGSSKICPI
jgi:hypothetical protein